PSFLPVSARGRDDRVSLYVATAHPGAKKPSPAEVGDLTAEIVACLEQWGWIEDCDVVDCSWVETAYTWTRPASRWVDKGIRALADLGVVQAGRCARWGTRVSEQSIASSIRDGLLAGTRSRATRTILERA